MINYDILSFEARRKPINLFKWQKGSDTLLQNIEDEIKKHGGYYMFRDQIIIECAKYNDRKSRLAARVRMHTNALKNPSDYKIKYSHLRTKNNAIIY